MEFLIDDNQKLLPFYIHSLEHNYQIAIKCLKIMNEKLKFNICNLSSSHLSNDRIEDLDEVIALCIPGHLFYACIFWGDHLDEDWFSEETSLLELKNLIHKRFLFWLEVLSLTNMVHTAFKSLENAAQIPIVQVKNSILLFISCKTNFDSNSLFKIYMLSFKMRSDLLLCFVIQSQ